MFMFLLYTFCVHLLYVIKNPFCLEICKKFKILKPTRVTVGDSNSQPATISSVVLEREISRHVCQEGVNYFFEGSEFVVKGGCKGVFTVCYTVKKTTPAPLTTTTEARKRSFYIKNNPLQSIQIKQKKLSYNSSKSIKDN